LPKKEHITIETRRKLENKNYDPVFGKRWEQYRTTRIMPDIWPPLRTTYKEAVWLKHITYLSVIIWLILTYDTSGLSASM